VRALEYQSRSADTDYIKYINNQKLYDKANIPCIDNYIINLICDHFLQTSQIRQNSLIYGMLCLNPMYYERTLTIFISSLSKAFLYLDQKGCIQDDKNVPLISFLETYNNKKLEYLQYSNSENTNVIWRYNMIPNEKKN